MSILWKTWTLVLYMYLPEQVIEMKTSEAYQKYILDKGLADTIHYDEFAVWWASKGITEFYKEQEEFKRSVSQYLQSEGLTHDPDNPFGDINEGEAGWYGRNWAPTASDVLQPWKPLSIRERIDRAIIRATINFLDAKRNGTFGLGGTGRRLAEVYKYAYREYAQQMWDKYGETIRESNRPGLSNLGRRSRARYGAIVAVVTALVVGLRSITRRDPNRHSQRASGLTAEIQRHLHEVNEDLDQMYIIMHAVILQTQPRIYFPGGGHISPGELTSMNWSTIIANTPGEGSGGEEQFEP